MFNLRLIILYLLFNVGIKNMLHNNGYGRFCPIKYRTFTHIGYIEYFFYTLLSQYDTKIEINHSVRMQCFRYSINRGLRRLVVKKNDP